jgi:N-acetylmuramoyl-L-alanine amidase
LYVSIHNNAAGNGKEWKNAQGWSVYVYRKASEKSRKLAEYLFDECKGLKTRKETPSRKYWESGLYVCKNTNCPAVLTENFFQDNKDDVKFLLSDEGKKKIIDIHVNGIINYIKNEL